MDKLGDLGHIFGISGQNYTWQICPVSVRYPDSVRILCPVSVCPDSVCLDSVRCQDSVRIFRKKSFPVSVCPDSVCLDSVRCPDFVRISQKNSVRCLSVRPDKDKTELSGLSLSLSADVCFSGRSDRKQKNPPKMNLTLTDNLCSNLRSTKQYQRRLSWNHFHSKMTECESRRSEHSEYIFRYFWIFLS